jgi:hypothetical protein
MLGGSRGSPRFGSPRSQDAEAICRSEPGGIACKARPSRNRVRDPVIMPEPRTRSPRKILSRHPYGSWVGTPKNTPAYRHRPKWRQQRRRRWIPSQRNHLGTWKSHLQPRMRTDLPMDSALARTARSPRIINNLRVSSPGRCPRYNHI